MAATKYARRATRSLPVQSIADEAVREALSGAFTKTLHDAATRHPKATVGDTLEAYLAAVREQLERCERASPFRAAQ